MGQEIEVKLGVEPDFVPPALDGVAAGIRTEAGPSASLDATYHDAGDLRLIRAGITLRHRLGEGGADGTWTLKLPNPVTAPAGALRREETLVAGPAGAVPAELATLVRPWLRTATLAPVARLQTERRTTRLVRDDDDGGDAVVVGEVDDDEVTVLDGDRVAARFREIEVEVQPEAVDLLDAAVERLRAAGAGPPDPHPKLVRALGLQAVAPPDLVVEAVGPSSSAAAVVRAGFGAAVVRVVEHDAVIRADVDPEGIHQARVGLRRLRSDLRTFAPILDPAWSEPLRTELGWLAGELGAVRDRDVMAANLRAAIDALGPDAPAAAGLLERLGAEREVAVREAVAALDSDRYLALLDRLVDAARSPRTLPAADAPAADVLPGLAGAAFAKLRKRVKRLGRHPSADALHELRIKAKRARYAVDVAVPVVGHRAKATAKAIGALQDVLGNHQDCAVAEAWLRGALHGASPEQAFALGRLVADQQRRAEALRAVWRKAWKPLRARKRTSWLSR